MKERYEALELNIVKIPVEDTIMMMSNLGDGGDVEVPPELGGEDLGFQNSDSEVVYEKENNHNCNSFPLCHHMAVI